MTLDHTIRNAIGKTLAAGAALYVGICGLPGLAGKEDVQVYQQPPAAEQQVQGSYLEQAANELFRQGVAEAASGDDYDMPADSQLKEYMHQPVEDTLGTEGVDYIEVTDQNYDNIVKGSDKPVMVLFYVDNNEPDYVNPSRGVGTLAAVLDEKFEENGVQEGYAGDQILFCAYQIKEGENVYSDSIDKKMFSTYPIEDYPAIAFYSNDKGDIEHVWTLNGGFSELSKLKEYTSPSWVNSVEDNLLSNE